MSVREDLEGRALSYGQAIWNDFFKLLKIELMDIPEEAKEFYEKESAEIERQMNILSEKYYEVVVLIPVTVSLLSETDKYTFEPATFELSKKTTEMPNVSFKALRADGSEETEVTFTATLLGVSYTFEHNGTEYVTVEKTGEMEMIDPEATGLPMYIDDGSERDIIVNGRERLGKDEFDELIKSARIGLDIKNRYIENMNYIDFKDVEDVAFINCEFGKGCDFIGDYTTVRANIIIDNTLINTAYMPHFRHVKTLTYSNCIFPPNTSIINRMERKRVSSNLTEFTMLSTTGVEEVHLSEEMKLNVVSIGNCKDIKLLDIYNSNVKKLRLDDLPELTAYETGIHTIEELTITDCPKLPSLI